MTGRVGSRHDPGHGEAQLAEPDADEPAADEIHVTAPSPGRPASILVLDRLGAAARGPGEVIPGVEQGRGQVGEILGRTGTGEPRDLRRSVQESGAGSTRGQVLVHPCGTGRAAGFQRDMASTEANTGSTRRPSGPSTVTIESSWLLSTDRPCAPTSDSRSGRTSMP